MSKIKWQDVNAICHDCAKEHGAKWPEGHIATFWMDECGVCHKSLIGVCAMSDWAWPKEIAKKVGTREL